MPDMIPIGELTSVVEKAVKTGTATAMEKVDQVSKAIAEVREANRELAAKVQGGFNDAKTKAFSIAKYLYGRARERFGVESPWEGAEHERDVAKSIRDARKKAWSVGNDASFGAAIGTQVLPIVETLRSREIVTRLGITTITAQGGKVEIPLDTDDPTLGEKPENTAADESTPGNGGVIDATPHKVTGIVKLSKSMLRCGFGADKYVQNKLLQKYLRHKQTRFYAGTGFNGQVKGLGALAGRGTVGFSAAPSVTKILDMLKTLEANNADTDASTVKFSMHPRLKYAIAQITIGASSNGYPILHFGDPTKGIASTIFGVPYETTTDIAVSGGTSTSLWLTVGSEIVEVLFGGGPEVDLSDQAGTSWESDQVWAKIVSEYDLIVPRESCVVEGTACTVT